MKVKKVLIIIITVAAILAGIIFNLQEYINDYWPVNIKNVIVTITYIVIWIIVISISMKYKYFRMIKAYSVFWLVTLIHAMLLILSKTTGAYVGWAILSAILFLCPWYGLFYYIKDSIIIGVLITICSLSILVINSFFIHLNNKHKPIQIK